MTLTPAQRTALSHLRRAYLGPEGGPEETLSAAPVFRYAVGMLFPGSGAVESLERLEPTAETETLSDEADLEDPEAVGAGIPTPDDQRPSSVALSFVTDRPSVTCHFAGGTYSSTEKDGQSTWRRRPFAIGPIELAMGAAPRLIDVNGLRVEIGARWRPHGSNQLVTVHVRSRETSSGNKRMDAARTIFQVDLGLTPSPGGAFLEYDPYSRFTPDEEAAELRVRYRDRQIFAVGHGTAAGWDVVDGVCERIRAEAVPAHVVPAVETTGLGDGEPAATALELAHLATITTDKAPVIHSLAAFVESFERWVADQDEVANGLGSDAALARRIVERSRKCAARMRESINLLDDDAEQHTRTAFALGMKAMRLQMLRGRSTENDDIEEPRWRPFQLGFLLVSLASTTQETHEDRELVDLIWFPTGGGKTEAYLGLAAIEIFRRRLEHGTEGSGTAVITRYTLRLLTAQQFQRAASLVCAMELLRKPGEHEDPRVRPLAPFSIGLWVGNDVTPGTRKEAVSRLDELRKASAPREKNVFQIEKCPWCDSHILPEERRQDPSEYGVRQIGASIQIHCPDLRCPFHAALPVTVIDEEIYEQHPTILLATVDKFARLQFKPEAGAVLGLGAPYLPPSLIIQDELHLLSGPLGTTVAVFDAVIQVLLSMKGTLPKIVASTATIRSSAEQVRGLYGRKVALYPPSGLDADRTFFSRPVPSGEGRLYIGLMPQAMPQVSALVSTVAPALEIPHVLDREQSGQSLDDYWTTVLYHNSLRELGRTGSLLVDDINTRVESRAERLSLPARDVASHNILELTSRRGPAELQQALNALGRRAPDPNALDVVLSSNMLSVGIDISRLALMIMVGQPKTTAEYIQATSRVGRGEVNGIVLTLFRPQRARDRSHFETFRGYHDALYRNVEPTSVTPWSLASRERSLSGALIMLLRLTISSLRENSAAVNMRLDDAVFQTQVRTVCDRFLDIASRADADEAADTRAAVERRLREWDDRAYRARRDGEALVYDRTRTCTNGLMKRFGLDGDGWLVGDSMRSVEPNVAVRVEEP